MDLEKLCAEGRCDKENGTWKTDEKDRVVFNEDLSKFIEDHPEMRSQMGGWQGKVGQFTSLLGDYLPNSLSDKVAEAYAGTHDTFNSPIWYGPDGNVKQGLSETQRTVDEVTNYLNVIPATPFALSVLLPPEVWNAIQVGIKVVKP